MRAVSLGFFLLMGLACHNTEEVCDEAALVPATLLLGTWVDESFEVWEEGDLLEPVWGPQGGKHIWGAVRATGINPGDGEMVADGGGFFGEGELGGGLVADGHDVVKLTFGFQFEEDLIAERAFDFATFLVGTPAESESTAQTVFVDPWELAYVYPDQLDVEAVMSVSLEDACGTVLTDSRALRIAQDEEVLASYTD